MIALLFLTLNARSLDRSLTAKDLLSNKHLNRVLVITLTATILVVYAPTLQSIFVTVGLSLSEWATVVGVSMVSTTGLWAVQVLARKGQVRREPSRGVAGARILD
jgi:magnesium-transporting ATPase (P-type)